MGTRLVTIATFDQPAQARLAKNALDEEGIRSAISDENLVAMDWLLSNAVGGVKVQVWEEDADRAVAVLERKFGENGEGLGAAGAPEDLAAQAEAAPPDEGEEPPPPSDGAESDAVPPPSEREEYARRLVFTAFVGMIFPPVVVYAVYLLLNALFGGGGLTSRGRFNLYLGGAMTVAMMVWFVYFVELILAP